VRKLEQRDHAAIRTFARADPGRARMEHRMFNGSPHSAGTAPFATR
jgi:hypothetical protein